MSAAERLPCHGELQAALCTQYTCMPAHPQKHGLQSRCNAWGDKESLVTAAGHLPSKTIGVVQHMTLWHTSQMVWHQVSGQMLKVESSWRRSSACSMPTLSAQIP